MMGMAGRGLMRAILELLIETVAYEEEEGKSAKEINEELSTGDWDEYFEQEPRSSGNGRPHQAEEVSLPMIRAALKVMGRPNGNRPEVVLRAPGPRFYLNAEGVDRLPGRDDPGAAVATAINIADDEDDTLFGGGGGIGGEGDDTIFGGDVCVGMESQIAYDGSEADDDEYTGSSCVPTTMEVSNATVGSLGRTVSAPAGPPVLNGCPRPPSFNRSASFSAPFMSRRERQLERARRPPPTRSYKRRAKRPLICSSMRQIWPAVLRRGGRLESLHAGLEGGG